MCLMMINFDSLFLLTYSVDKECYLKSSDKPTNNLELAVQYFLSSKIQKSNKRKLILQTKAVYHFVL